MTSASLRSEHPDGMFEVFDYHLHAHPPELFAPMARAQFGAWRRTVGHFVAEPEAVRTETLTQMERANVRGGLVSGNAALVRQWVLGQPGRLLASFEPDLTLADHHAAAAEFEAGCEAGDWHALGELGLPYFGRPLDDPILDPYYEVCERRGLPVSFHTGLSGPEPQQTLAEPFRITLGDPLLLESVICRFPQLRIVVMHMGWPFFDHALYLLYTYRTVYLDTALVDWILGPRLFERMLAEAADTVGPDRILFGSDQTVWPGIIPEAVRAITRVSFLSDSDKQRILWDNAFELLGLHEPTLPASPAVQPHA